MSQRRVLMVTEPGIDGVLAVVDAIVRQIHRAHPDILVDVAYSSRRSGPALWEMVRAVEAHGGEAIDLRVGNAPGPSDLPALRDLVRFTRRRHHDIVHAHSSKAGALARIAGAITAFPPVLYTPHAYFGMPQLGTPKEAVFNLVESVLGRVGHTISNSEDERDFAVRSLRVPAGRIRVIHNGIDADRFSPPTPQAKAAARKTLGLPESGKILVSIGRFSSQKNYGPLYSALDALLPDAGWSFSQAGAGSTDLRSGLCPAAAARCHNFEHLDDVVPLLQAADGYVMTSRYEGLSLAMLSALSCGLPAFLTDVPGFHFLRGYGFDEIGWLPGTDLPERLEEALKSALSAWALRPAEVCFRQREIVREYFSEPVQIEKIISSYQPQPAA